MKILINRFKGSCSGGRTLRNDLSNEGFNAKLIRQVGSKYKHNPYADLVINWGDSGCVDYANMLNRPAAIAMATDKLKSFHALLVNNVSCTPIMLNKGAAISYLQDDDNRVVFCRGILNGSKGKGIVVAKTVDELIDCKLYTGGIVDPDRTEYRVHVFNGKVIHQQQKKRRDGWKDNPNFSDTVRNLNGGWVFAIKDVEVSAEVAQQSIKAVQALGLDFGGVDVVEDSNGNAYVIEVNTACGLHGSTTGKYSAAIKDYVANV